MKTLILLVSIVLFSSCLSSNFSLKSKQTHNTVVLFLKNDVTMVFEEGINEVKTLEPLYNEFVSLVVTYHNGTVEYYPKSNFILTKTTY